MTQARLLKALGVFTAFGAIAFGMLSEPQHVRARSDGAADQSESRIQRGFEIAPVPLNLHGKNPALVGLGSYIVNSVGDCNGCHSRPRDRIRRWRQSVFPDSSVYWGKEDQHCHIFGGRPRFRSDRIGSASLLPQSDARQDWFAGRRTQLRRIRRDHEAWDRFGSRPPQLHFAWRSSQLFSTALRQGSSPGHAVAILQGHDRSRTPRNLRVPERDSLQSRTRDCRCALFAK